MDAADNNGCPSLLRLTHYSITRAAIPGVDSNTYYVARTDAISIKRFNWLIDNNGIAGKLNWGCACNNK